MIHLCHFRNLAVRLHAAYLHSPLLLLVLIAALGLRSNALATAQTLRVLHGFTEIPASLPYTNSDGAPPYAGLILSGITDSAPHENKPALHGYSRCEMDRDIRDSCRAKRMAS